MGGEEGERVGWIEGTGKMEDWKNVRGRRGDGGVEEGGGRGSDGGSGGERNGRREGDEGEKV